MPNKGLSSFSGQDAGTPVAACAPAGGKWDQECVRKIFCATDPAVVADLARVDMFIADDLQSEIWEYDGSKWELKKSPIKGAAGDLGGTPTVEMDSCQSCDEAATFIYHEMVHTKQPAAMSVKDRETEAYKKTEEWGLKQKGRKLTQGFRKTVGGVEQVDDAAIDRHVKKNYPVPDPGKPVVTGHRTDKTWIFFDKHMSEVEDPVNHTKTWIESEVGHRHAEGIAYSRDSPVDRSKWTCP